MGTENVKSTKDAQLKNRNSHCATISALAAFVKAQPFLLKTPQYGGKAWIILPASLARIMAQEVVTDETHNAV